MTQFSREIFQKLVTQYCRLIRIEDFDRVLEGRPIIIDGIPVSILYSEKQRPDSLIIYSELGTLPETGRHQIEQKILEANAIMYLSSGSCFTRLHHQGAIVHSSVCSLKEMTANSLCNLVESLVQNAQRWKLELFE